MTSTRWAFNKKVCRECASYAGTPFCSNLSSSMNGIRKESRSLGCDGPGHSPRGMKLSTWYLAHVRPDKGGNTSLRAANLELKRESAKLLVLNCETIAPRLWRSAEQQFSRR